MKRIQLSIVLTVILLLILLLHINYLRFVCDDAFISFRYAKSFIQGHGLVYNIGEKVEGYTNFLWTMLLSLFMGLGLNVVVVSQVLGVLFSIATILLLLHLNRLLYPGDNLFNYLAPLFLVCCGAYAAWSTGGLETAFYTFLVFLGSYLFIWGMKESSHFALSGIIFALVCMTRLDGLIFAGITFIWLFYLTVIKKRIGYKALVLWTLCFLAPFLAYFIWRWSYYGRFLPNTYYVKVGGFSLYHQGLYYLFDFVRRFRLWLLIIPLAFLSKAVKSNIRLKMIIPYFISLISVFSLYVVYVGGDFMDMFRFLVPILPMFFFLVQEGFRGIYSYPESTVKNQIPENGKPSLKQQPTREKHRRTIWTTAEICLIILCLFLLILPSRESDKMWNRKGIDSIRLLREYSRLWSRVGMMFKEIARPGESLSTTAAGAIPFYSELYTIDEFDLALTSVSRSDLIVNKARPGHNKLVTDEYIVSRKPTYVLGHPKIYEEFERPQWEWVVKEPFASAGYKIETFRIRISDSEAIYVYFMSQRRFDSP
jgi:arabinofuranosyltransferase